MKLKLKYIGFLITAVFLLLSVYPAHAGDVEQIRQMANQYIADHYKIPSFFEPSVRIENKTVGFKAVFDYDISEIEGIKFKPKYIEMPAICYESDNRGDYENGVYQFLGQTKDGETVTDVRFPLKSSWGENTYMEDLNWVADPWNNPAVRNWWQSYSGSKLEMSRFDVEFRRDPVLAADIDARIMVSNIAQVRREGGKELPISDFWDFSRERPKCVDFPWHKYVHVTIPPTETTWGYGIGFVNHGGRLGYKSFPIAPYGLELVLPDFYPTADQTVYTGEPGETVTVNVKLNNKGDKDITNFAWTEYGGGWGNPKWLDTDVELDDGQSKDYTVDFVVTNQPQKYVFAANVYGDKPRYELNKANNSLVIIVAPDGVDLAASIAPTQKTYRARSFPYMTACNVSGIRLDNGDYEVPAVINVTLSDGQNRVFNHTFKAGGKWGQPAIWDIKKPGTYTARVEIQPIGYKDTNPANNVATCTFTVVAQEITPPKNTGDDDIRGGLGSM